MNLTENEINLLDKMRVAGLAIPFLPHRYLYKFRLSQIALILNYSQYYVRNWVRSKFYSPIPEDWFQKDLKKKSPWYVSWERVDLN